MEAVWLGLMRFVCSRGVGIGGLGGFSPNIFERRAEPLSPLVSSNTFQNQ